MIDMMDDKAVETVGARTLTKLRKSHAGLALLHHLRGVVGDGVALQIIKGNQKLPKGYERFSFDDVPGLRNLDKGAKTVLAEFLEATFEGRATRKFLLFRKLGQDEDVVAKIITEVVAPF